MRFSTITALSITTEAAKAVTMKNHGTIKTLSQVTKSAVTTSHSSTVGNNQCDGVVYSDASMAKVDRPIALPPNAVLSE